MNPPEDRYRGWALNARLVADTRDKVEAAYRRAVRNRTRVEPVAKRCGIPWALAAALMERESSGKVDAHPANGDPLDEKTVHEPKGLPKESDPPYTYESVAEEEYREIWRPDDGVWTLSRMMKAAERFNGLGYWKHGMRSPYIVALTTLEMPGKYIADGQIDYGWKDEQVGCLALWLMMMESGEDIP